MHLIFLSIFMILNQNKFYGGKVKILGLGERSQLLTASGILPMSPIAMKLLSLMRIEPRLL